MPEVSLTPSCWKGENGHWLHPPPSRLPPSRKATARQVGVAGIAIDRFDGTIVGQQLDEVTE
jgi:hypothetical protein